MAELERAATIDRNLVDAYGFIGLGKYIIARYHNAAQTHHPAYFAKRVRVYEGMRLARVPGC
jgi:hypothetical protein